MFCVYIATAQTPARPSPSSNLRHKAIPAVLNKNITVDTLPLIPGSVSILGVSADQYLVDHTKSVIYWRVPPQDSIVQVYYRVFPFHLNASAQRMNFDSLLLYSAAPIPPKVDINAAQRSLFNFGDINAQGSFGRQVGFGNNQDVVLNSNLNIQLSGMLADSIELQAAITDNNIPIQPDGNTQQLNEFDEVYIRFKKKNWQLNIGDMDLRENRSYFLNFYKRLQGISFQTINNLSKKIQSNTLVSGSIAKGKFTRNVFQGLEGNQGPYRLAGANNEVFFIVLANTERVFIDGELLQRGEDRDYVINYNTAEVTFTPRRMITKDSRIQIEFEYADRNFLNTNLFAMQETSFGNKIKMRVGYFSNSDAKNSSINQVLDTRQKQFLSEIGDSIQNAYYPSALLDSFAAGKVLYERVYDTVDNRIDSFYRYSINPAVAKYNVAFTEVGFGRGNYVPDENNANGKVFRYIAPVNGIRQGNFEPVILLVAPRRQVIVNLGIDYHISENTVLKTEIARSSFDVNTLSRLQDDNDDGYALKANLSNAKTLRQKNKLQLLSSIDYEYVQQKFQPVERLRNVEFTRDWGLPLVTQRATEHILRAATGLRSASGNALQYQFTSYTRSDNYKGFQNSLTQFTQWKNWLFNNQFVITNYNSLVDKGYFLKPVIDISKSLPWLYNWKLGARYTLEENNSRNKFSDSLNATAFSFDTYTAYLRSGDNAKNKYGVNFYTRSDKYPVGKELLRGDRSYNLNLMAEILSNAKRQFYLNTTFRKLKVYNATVSPQEEDNTLLTRAEYVMNEFNGFLSGNVLYEAGSGQEQKRDYAYLEVPAGTGQYTWIDYNEDGVQQLNEFELAAFIDQAKFIRIFTPTNEYIKANYTTLNYSFNLNPRLLWPNAPARSMKKFLSRFNVLTSLQISKKVLATGLFEFNPFSKALNDTNLITLTTVLVNTLSFNRQSTVWGFDVSNIRNSNKAFLTYGYEFRQNNDWILQYRHFLSKTITLNINTVTGINSLLTQSNLFDNRNYYIHKKSAEPLLSYVKGTSFRVTGGYKYEVKNNSPQYGGEQVMSNSLTAETKYNILQSASITGKFTYQNLKYTSANPLRQTTVSYIMLDGLLPGKNYLWNIMLTKRLLTNLELTFQYDGRKPGDTRTIHTGRASLTAIF